MKHLLLLLTLLVGGGGIFVSSLRAQECTPDPELGSQPGVVPDTLPDGVVGQPYEAVLNFILPKDTTVLGQQLSFCEFSLKETTPSLEDLGLEVTCNTPDCIFPVNHGDTVINRYCAVLYGTPAVALDSIEVFVTASIGQYVANQDTCIIPPNITPLGIGYKLKFNISETTSVRELSRQGMNLRLYPNPTRGSSTLQFDLPEAAAMQIELFDMIGRRQQVVFAGQLTPGSHRYSVGDNQLPSGMYFLRMNLNNGERVFTERLVISK